MIIIDTPGFNTLVRSHEDVTLSVIPQAQFLIYVMGKSLTDYDVKFLRKIEEMGIELIFVRTKLDEIKPSEESLEDLLQLENTKLQSHFERTRPFFAITSESELLRQSEWQWRINAVQDYISSQINPRLQDLWNHSLRQRLLILGRDFMCNLKEKQELLQSAGSVNVEMLQEQVTFLENQIQSITKSHYTNSKRIQSELAPFQMKMKSDANQYMEDCAAKFERNVSLQSSIEAMQKWTQNSALEQVEEYMQRIQMMFTNYTQQMIEQGFKEAQSRIQEISEQLESTLNLKKPFKLNLPDTDRINHVRQYAVDQLQEELELLAELLQQSDDELRKYDLTTEKVQAMAQEMGRFVSEARSEVDGIETYTPQMKFVEGNQNISELMGQIGNIADWLTLLIPGKNAATIVTKVEKVAKVTQIAQRINVSTKTLQAATKTIETAAKGVDLLKKVDKVKDILNDAKDFQSQARQIIPKEQSGLLDLITLEYWFSKAGKLFDTPSHYELDKIAEAGYLNRKRELEQRHLQAIQKELNQLEKLHLLRKKEDRLKKEKELQLRNQKSLEKQLQVERERVGKEATVMYAQQLTRLFEEELSRVHAMLLTEIEQAYRNQVQAIIISATIESKQRIESMQDNLQKLLEEKHHKTADKDRAVQQVTAFLEFLNVTAESLEGDDVCIH